MKKVLITGITGFAGSHLMDYILENTDYEVYGLKRMKSKLFYCPPERQDRLKVALNMNPFPFSFEKDGTSVVYIGDKYWDR